MDLLLRVWVEKKVHVEETYWFSGAALSKEGYTDSYLGYERTDNY